MTALRTLWKTALLAPLSPLALAASQATNSPSQASYVVQYAMTPTVPSALILVLEPAPSAMPVTPSPTEHAPPSYAPSRTVKTARASPLAKPVENSTQ